MNRLTLIFLAVVLSVNATALATVKPYRDLSHFSKVFGREKQFRLYLPDEYQETKEHFPVVYFFHGWGGRYFKDPSATPEYDLLGHLVNKYRLILVMWDGSMEETEPRPYNTGNHKDVKYQVQMKDYFPELIAYVDSSFRTLKERENRGIIGFSMGGFIATFLSGKYPDKVSAAASLTGSPEFFIGHPDNHTLLPVRYALDNLSGVDFLFHNREECPMAGLNDEVITAAAFTGMKNFRGLKLPGGHKLDEPGETEIFESVLKFIADRFKNPLPSPVGWSHFDIYPDFEVWDYVVHSNKKEPGYLCLRNVTPSGFGFYSQKWLPDGRAIRNLEASVLTAPLYKAGASYTVSLFYPAAGKSEKQWIQADAEGRILIRLPGERVEVSIQSQDMPAGFIIARHQFNQPRQSLMVNEPNRLSLQILVRNGKFNGTKKVRISLTCPNPQVKIDRPVMEIMPETGQVVSTPPFGIVSPLVPPPDGTPASVRLLATFEWDDQTCTDHVDLPVDYDVPTFRNLRVLPDKWTANHTPLLYEDLTRVIKGGKNDLQLVASPGQQVIVLNDTLPLRLYVTDRYVVTDNEEIHYIVLPAHWPDGFTPVSSIKIADDCPDGYVIECLGHCETKTWMPAFRKVTWGKVRLTVKK